MKRSILFLVVLLLPGCEVSVTREQLEACAKTCTPHGVASVTSLKCTCAVPGGER